jgi:hypothetical protein
MPSTFRSNTRGRREGPSRWIARASGSFVVTAVLIALCAPSTAQFYVNISAPPLLTSYAQPQLSVANEIWTPGYWAMGPAGYYWVPGTWAHAPSPGLLYTPGYWNASQNGYNWNQGYWARNVGYYGGVNYGAGYYGNGYAGGAWSGRTFRYNTAVTNVNATAIRNVYVNRTVVVRTVDHVSYYGGYGGLRIQPTPAQLAAAREQHYPLTSVQREHIVVASHDRNLLVTVNHGKPPLVVVARPLSATNRPLDFKPIAATKPAEVAKPATGAAHPPAKTANADKNAKSAKPAAHPAAKQPSEHANP